MNSPSALQLKGVSEYSILSSSGCTVLEGVDDADRFKAIQDAFTTVGVDSEAQLQVCIHFLNHMWCVQCRVVCFSEAYSRMEVKG